MKQFKPSMINNILPIAINKQTISKQQDVIITNID